MTCRTCNGTGGVDSGGQTPWGSWISVACPDCPPQKIMFSDPNFVKQSLIVFDEDRYARANPIVPISRKRARHRWRQEIRAQKLVRVNCWCTHPVGPPRWQTIDIYEADEVEYRFKEWVSEDDLKDPDFYICCEKCGEKCEIEKIP